MVRRGARAVVDRSDAALSRLRLRDLRPRDATVIVNTLFLLLAIQPAIRLAGLKFTARWAGRLLGRRSGKAPVVLDDLEIERIARLIRGCCRRWPFGATCLDRSLVSLALLGRHGVPACLIIGFNRSNEGVKGHAWVEFEARPLAESIDVIGRYLHQVVMHWAPDGSIAMNTKRRRHLLVEAQVQRALWKASKCQSDVASAPIQSCRREQP